MALTEQLAVRSEGALSDVSTEASCGDCTEAKKNCSPRDGGREVINGIVYPGFIRAEAVHSLQTNFIPRSGDVIIVSHFPLRGLQRMLVALVEGGLDPWAAGLLDRPYFLEAGASRRGVDDYLLQIATWKERRCFKSHAFPALFPCRWPFEHHSGEGPAPKVVVLVADPRYALSISHEILVSKNRCGAFGTITMEDFIEAVVEERFQVFGNFFEHALAWGHEAQKYPETVRLFSVDRFASHDPKQVKAAFTELAEFLEVPKAASAASRLVAALFERPANAPLVLAKDCLPSYEAIAGGPLIEMVGPRLQRFQESLLEVRAPVQDGFRRLLSSWFDCPEPCLARLAETAARGVASLLPVKLNRSLKGDSVHAAGECKPCVFSLRGLCRDGPVMCSYCHAEGHAKTKRASRHKRNQRRTRVYTPSPEGLST